MTGDQLLLFLKEKYEENGPISYYEVDGEKHFFINHPDLIEQVMHKKHKLYHKSDFYKELRHVIGNGLLTVEGGQDWLWQRKMTQPSFNRKKIDGFASEIDLLAEEVINSFRTKRDSATGKVQVHNEFVKITLAVICRTLLGIKATDEANIIIKNFPFILRFISARVFHPNPLDLSENTPSNKKFLKCMNELEGIVTKYIDVRLEEHAAGQLDGDNLLADLIQQKDEDTGEPMSYKEIRDHVMTQFLAGHETTVTSLTYICYHLATHPEWQEKILSDIVEDKHWSEYKVLLAFIYESLRLYPPITVISKVAMEDDMLGEHFIPKGAFVSLSPFVLQRTAAFWDNPETFQPERFYDFDLRTNKYLYIPFSVGPRICIGMQLALMEMVIITKKLVTNFKFSTNDNTSKDFMVSLSLRSKNGMPVNLNDR